MKEIFAAWLAWLTAQGVDQRDLLNPPASEAQIAALEQAVGKPLPEDLKALYRITNGQQASLGRESIKGRIAVPLFGQYDFLSTDGAIAAYDSWQLIYTQDGADFDENFNGVITVRGTDPVYREYWSPGWLPFSIDGGGNSYAVDLSPAPGGTVGQIIIMGPDEDHRRVLAPSLSAWLQQRRLKPIALEEHEPGFASFEMEPD